MPNFTLVPKNPQLFHMVSLMMERQICNLHACAKGFGSLNKPSGRTCTTVVAAVFHVAVHGALCHNQADTCVRHDACMKPNSVE